VLYASGTFGRPGSSIMNWIARYFAPCASIVSVCLLAANSLCAQSNGPSLAFGTCKPASERTTEVGCWILVDQPMGGIEHPAFSIVSSHTFQVTRPRFREVLWLSLPPNESGRCRDARRFAQAGETCLERDSPREANWPLRWAARDRARRSSDATHRHRHRTAPCVDAHSSRIVEAAHHCDPRLDAERLV
jgi:hypothetical protein